MKCSVCDKEFTPKNSRQHVCFDETCKRENSRKAMNAWKWRTGRADPNKKNWWTEEELDFLRDNRHMSTSELADALGRSSDTVKGKRSRLGLPQLAICNTCGCEFQRINQHSQCEHCTPDQRGYAADYRNSLNGRWQMYKNNASRRNIEFNPTISDFAALWSKPCHYCGDAIKTIGVDRIDSARAYEMENVVACCGRCNEMKMGATIDEWLDHMKKILRHMEVAK